MTPNIAVDVAKTTQTTSPALENTARQAEEAQLRADQARQRYQVQVIEAVKQLDAQTAGDKVGLFGGVKELSVQLRNPSVVAFKSVAVKVQYLKGSGRLLKSSVMYFNNVGPGATVTRRAPDSQRGTRFSARILQADPEKPDSIATDLPLNP